MILYHFWLKDKKTPIKSQFLKIREFIIWCLQKLGRRAIMGLFILALLWHPQVISFFLFVYSPIFNMLPSPLTSSSCNYRTDAEDPASPLRPDLTRDRKATELSSASFLKIKASFSSPFQQTYTNWPQLYHIPHSYTNHCQGAQTHHDRNGLNEIHSLGFGWCSDSPGGHDCQIVKTNKHAVARRK